MLPPLGRRHRLRIFPRPDHPSWQSAGQRIAAHHLGAVDQHVLDAHGVHIHAARPARQVLAQHLITGRYSRRVEQHEVGMPAIGEAAGLERDLIEQRWARR